jgi:hypothetical protein
VTCVAGASVLVVSDTVLAAERHVHSMRAVIERYLNADAYHPDAVATARVGSLADLTAQMLIVRLCDDFTRDDKAAAERTLHARAADAFVGYARFQFDTARLIMARRRDDRDAFMSALDSWLTARLMFPGNWSTDVLDATEFAPWLADIDPARLAPPVPPSTELTDEDRAWVQDIAAARRLAVAENLEWIRELQIEGTVDEISSQYQLTYVSREICEATISGSDDLPDITLTLEPDGSYRGSFLSH